MEVTENLKEDRNLTHGTGMKDKSRENKTRIAFVTQPWDEVIPSVENSSIPIITYQLAKRLADTCNVIIYAKQGNNQSRVERDEHGLQIRRVHVSAEEWMLKPAKVLYRLLASRRSKHPLYAASWYHIGYILQVAMDLRKQACDIVHIFNFSQFIPVIRAFNPEVKIVLHMECEWLTQLDPLVIEPRLRKTDMIIGCSDFITNGVRELYPQVAHKCTTVFNAVDHERFISSDGSDTEDPDCSKRLLYVGRISPEKGIHVLLEAFKIVAKDYPDLKIELVGGISEAPYEFIVLVSNDEKTTDLASFYSDRTKLAQGRYFNHLQQQIPEHLTNKVHFVGSVSNEALYNYYQKADVLVFPSVWHEPFGIPLVEAMACRTPVVATISGGMTEIVVDGETGYLVERGDSATLAEAISNLVSDYELRVEMGEAGRDRVQKLFTWDASADRLMDQYEKILSIESS
jgi:glycosyltransferase involved in cell wall biosynthesis